MRTIQSTHELQLIEIALLTLVIALKSILLKALKRESSLKISHSLVHLSKRPLSNFLKRCQHLLQTQNNTPTTERPKKSLQVILTLNDDLNRGTILDDPHDEAILGRRQYFCFDHF